MENEKYSGAVTDINGEFQIALSPGDHLLTLGKFYDLRLFLKIVDGGPNPDNVELTVDTSRVCCVLSSGAAFPKPIVLPKPPYPAAAKAIRARGEVVVTVKVDHEGNVTSATAESGHRFLKGTAVAAAKSARFEPSTATEREARLTFFFWDEEPRDGLVRYSNQYRIEIVSNPVYSN
ncbi:MAG: TonB family protein [Chloracidobacterium sp.]|nr:TonB family protein [Chloracidobacterium sp.]